MIHRIDNKIIRILRKKLCLFLLTFFFNSFVIYSCYNVYINQIIFLIQMKKNYGSGSVRTSRILSSALIKRAKSIRPAWYWSWLIKCRVYHKKYTRRWKAYCLCFIMPLSPVFAIVSANHDIYFWCATLNENPSS